MSGLPLTIGSVLGLAVVLTIVGVGLSALGFLIAWPMDSTHASEREAVARYEQFVAAPAGAPPQREPITTDAGLTPESVRR